MLVMYDFILRYSHPNSDHDYALRFPDLWDSDIEAIFRNDFNHPSVILYIIVNDIPDALNPLAPHRPSAGV